MSVPKMDVFPTPTIATIYFAAVGIIVVVLVWGYCSLFKPQQLEKPGRVLTARNGAPPDLDLQVQHQQAAHQQLRAAGGGQKGVFLERPAEYRWTGPVALRDSAVCMLSRIPRTTATPPTPAHQWRAG
jgi:hypothetical protein